MTRRRTSLLLTFGIAISGGACAVRPSTLTDSEHVVLVKSVRLPDRDWLPWYTRFAEHVWLDYKLDGVWRRIEWDDIEQIRTYQLRRHSAFADERWERPVAVHDAFTGDAARRYGERIRAVGEAYPCRTNYRAWPGPNSNTFIEWLALEVGMPIELPATAIGKDFTTWLHAGVTSSGTGLEIETLPLGLEVGLRDGVELHLLGIGIGVGLWPPSVKLPFLPAIPGGWFVW